MLAASSGDRTVTIWSNEGKLLQRLGNLANNSNIIKAPIAWMS